MQPADHFPQDSSKDKVYSAVCSIVMLRGLASLDEVVLDLQGHAPAANQAQSNRSLHGMA
jgi:hypothetical protein